MSWMSLLFDGATGRAAADHGQRSPASVHDTRPDAGQSATRDAEPDEHVSAGLYDG